MAWSRGDGRRVFLLVSRAVKASRFGERARSESSSFVASGAAGPGLLSQAARNVGFSRGLFVPEGLESPERGFELVLLLGGGLGNIVVKYGVYGAVGNTGLDTEELREKRGAHKAAKRWADDAEKKMQIQRDPPDLWWPLLST